MKKNPILILGSAFLGPLAYFSRFILGHKILVEQFDYYNKQSYRNRCVIMGPNKIQNLVIPVKKTSGSRTRMKDIKIDYDTDWQRLHYHGIVSAYRSSPYFEHYFEDYQPFLTGKYKFLVDLNTEITGIVLQQLGLDPDFNLTEQYMRSNGEFLDLRDTIHPKKDPLNLPGFSWIEYKQVFSDRHGFIPNLSIIDLLFNLGPEAVLVLRSSTGTGKLKEGS